MTLEIRSGLPENLHDGFRHEFKYSKPPGGRAYWVYLWVSPIGFTGRFFTQVLSPCAAWQVVRN
jgi:hypothetical protein